MFLLRYQSAGFFCQNKIRCLGKVRLLSNGPKSSRPIRMQDSKTTKYLTNNLRYEVEVFDVKASFMKATNIIWLLQVGVVRYAWT